MKTLSIISIAFLLLFAVTCFAVAIIFGAWWHIGTGASAALLSWALYNEEKTCKS